MTVEDKIKFVMQELDSVYCYSCRFNNDGVHDGCPDDCYRKYMGWAISESKARVIVEKIMEK